MPLELRQSGEIEAIWWNLKLENGIDVMMNFQKRCMADEGKITVEKLINIFKLIVDNFCTDLH